MSVTYLIYGEKTVKGSVLEVANGQFAMPFSVAPATPPTAGCTGQWCQKGNELAPPFHISADGYADLSARFVDVDGDGRKDLVFHRYLTSTYTQKGVYLNKPNPNQSGDYRDVVWQASTVPAHTPPIPITSDSVSDLGVRFVDLDGDGDEDLVQYRWVNSSRSDRAVYFNGAKTPNGKVHVGWRQATAEEFALYVPPFHLSADGVGDLGARFVDVDGDLAPDLVFHRHFGSNYQAGAYLLKPDGWKAAPAYTPPVPISKDGGGDRGVRFVDVDGDADLDLVRHHHEGSVIHRYVYFNQASQGGVGWIVGTSAQKDAFVPPFHLAASGYYDLGARFVDMNGDGLKDLVYNRYLTPTYTQKGAYLASKTGWIADHKYAPPTHLSADGLPDIGTRFVDIDGDGDEDFVYHRSGYPLAAWANQSHKH